MHRSALLAAVTVAAALGVAGSAHAATLHLDGDTLVYTASPGAANWTFAELGSDTGRLRIADEGDHLQPGGGCTLPDPGDDTAVDCPMPARLRLELGDGEDRDTLRETLPNLPIEIDGGPGNDTLWANNDVDDQVTLDGGEGDDTLNGMQFADTLLGGPGKDTLHGNGGDDVLHGGEGDDTLEPDTMPDVIGNDLVDGGPGYDTVRDWGSASTDPAFSVAVSIDGIANDGRPAGEADNVIAVERIDALEPGHYVLGDTDDSVDLPDFGTSRVEGRGGNDTLTGGDGVETIDGGPGDDRLEGGYNNDVITGGPGRDTIYGDETSQRCSYLENCVIVPFGNDTINARDGEPDVIDCGVGNDTANVDPVDTVSNCETVNRGSGSGAKPGPAAGCRVPKGLKGRPAAVVKRRLRAAHCRTLRTRSVRSRTVRRGRVVRVAKHGRVVTVFVSKGRRAAHASAAAAFPGAGKDIAYAVRVEGTGTYSYSDRIDHADGGWDGHDVALSFTFGGEIVDGVVFRDATPLDTTGNDMAHGTADGTWTETGDGGALPACGVDPSFPPAHGNLRLVDDSDLNGGLVPLDGKLHLWIRPLDSFDVHFACTGEAADRGVDLGIPATDDAFDADGKVKVGKHPFDIAFELPRDVIGMGQIQQLDPSGTLEGTRCPGWLDEQTTTCRLKWSAKVTLTKLWEKRTPSSAEEDDDLLIPLVPRKRASLRRDASRANVGVTCRVACTGTARVQAARPGHAGAAAARVTRFRIAAGHTKRVTIRLDARTRRAVRRAGGARITVRTTMRGHAATRSVTVPLRR